jgi:hypothetical protein
MCRKLVALVALLSFASVASALTVIDDFESYFGPDIAGVWTDVDGNPSTNSAILLTSGAPQGMQAMEWDYHVAGGWSEPDNPASTAVFDNAQLGRDIPSLDFAVGGEFHLMVQAYNNDLTKTNWYLLQYSGDAAGAGQTWIPTATWTDSTGPWWNPHPLPAIIAQDGWTYVRQPWYGTDYTGVKVIHPSDGWQEIVIKDNMSVPWGTSLLSNYDAMIHFNVAVWTGWTDNSGASGAFKVGTDGATVWPLGPITGRLDVDNIYYIPEPATVALLGLGGLALIRRKK